ncbi:hypothetical protein BGZ75_004663, partial [Mortierella antarctica]
TMRRALQRLRTFRQAQDQQQRLDRPEQTETIWEHSDEEYEDEWEWTDNEVEQAASLALYTSSNMVGDEDDLAYPSYSQALGMSLGLCTQSYTS